MSERSDVFVQDWAAGNVHIAQGTKNYHKEVDRLCAALVADALVAGWTPDEIDQNVSDLDEYMTDACESAMDDELGFKKL